MGRTSLVKNKVFKQEFCQKIHFNLLLRDMASTVPIEITFFGVIQRFYTTFSSSVARWNILKKHLDTTLKPLLDTRWECRINAMKAIRHDLDKLLNAFIELSKTANYTKIKSESISLYEREVNVEFVLSINIWYDILLNVNTVSKSLKNPKPIF